VNGAARRGAGSEQRQAPGLLTTKCTGNVQEVMPRLLRRHRSFLTSGILGCGCFALFVGIANACTWDGGTAVPHQPTVAAHAVGDAIDHDRAPGGADCCSNDVPCSACFNWSRSSPAGQPLVLAAHHRLGVLPSAALVLRLARTSHPPPGVPFSLRIVRLTL